MSAWLRHIDWANVGAFLGVVTLVCGVLYRMLRRARRRLAKTGGELRSYFDDRMTQIAASIADPIVHEGAQMRRSIDHLHHSMSEANAECRIDREALWARVGGRP